VEFQNQRFIFRDLFFICPLFVYSQNVYADFVLGMGQKSIFVFLPAFLAQLSVIKTFSFLDASVNSTLLFIVDLDATLAKLPVLKASTAAAPPPWHMSSSSLQPISFS
jgi:hypothetical protein